MALQSKATNPALFRKALNALRDLAEYEDCWHGHTVSAESAATCGACAKLLEAKAVIMEVEAAQNCEHKAIMRGQVA